MNPKTVLDARTFVADGATWHAHRVELGRLESASSTVMMTDAIERMHPDELEDVPAFRFGAQVSPDVTVVMATPPAESAEGQSFVAALLIGDAGGSQDWIRLQRGDGRDEVVFSEGTAVLAFPVELRDRVIALQGDLQALVALVERVVQEGPLASEGLIAVPGMARALRCWGCLDEDGLLSALFVDFDPFRD